MLAAGGDWLELDWGGGGGGGGAGRVAAVWVRDNSRHSSSYDASARARTLLMADTEVEVRLEKVGPVTWQCSGMEKVRCHLATRIHANFRDHSKLPKHNLSYKFRPRRTLIKIVHFNLKIA